MKKSSLAIYLAGAATALFLIAAVLLFPRVLAVGERIFAPQPTPSLACEAMRPMIVFNGISYVPATTAEAAHQLTDADLGPAVGITGDGPHDIHNDCGLIAPGQQVYSIKGYLATFRLAVHKSNGISFFEVVANSQARNGGDLLDIVGKIAFITTGTVDHPSTPVAAIRDIQKVQALTQAVLSAPLAPCSTQGTGGANIPLKTLLFHLQDGNVVEVVFRADTRELILHETECLDMPASFAP